MSAVVRIRRRALLAAIGAAAGGLALGSFPEAHAATAADAPKSGDGLRPNAFVHVARDGTVSIVCARSEMGQGVRSSLPALVADELGADLTRIRIVQAEGDKKYGDQNTDGSSSVRGRYDELRRLGATAREMLIAAAAAKWHVPASSCKAEDHAVRHPPTKRALGFGELADDAAKLPVPDAAKVKLRPSSELRHRGKRLPLVDGADIVTGRAVYGADVRLPGMLTASIERPPVLGAKVAKLDASRARAIRGVKHVVEMPAVTAPYGFKPLGGVAVVADTTWNALRGRAALAVQWTDSEHGAYDTAAYREDLLASVRTKARVVRQTGDVDAAFASARRVIEAEYTTAHLAHAAMEPLVAVARFEGDACEIWTPTQSPEEARAEVAKALGIPEGKVTVHVTLLGGAFGRKAAHDYVVEAAFLSREVKAPVRVQWTREDDMRHDYYHASSAQRLRAALDEHGKLVAWEHRTAFPPIGSIFSGAVAASDGELGQGVLDVPIAAPNVRAENAPAHAHVRIGWLRSVCNIFHAFAFNAFVAELAHAKGADPRDTLLEVLGPARKVSAVELGVARVPNYHASLDVHPIDVGRLRHVIERVTELAGWSDARKNGRAVGLAAHRSFLTYVAAVASVVRAPGGKIAVDEAWIVCDAGTIINEDRVRAQLEGAVVFGMSGALYGAITARNGAVVEGNFRDFHVARIGDAPRKIHVEIVASDAPPGGVGEPGVPPIAPAIANAVFALTGERLRDLPLAPRRHA